VKQNRFTSYFELMVEGVIFGAYLLHQLITHKF